MNIHTLGSEARNARILAQRLYGQCRKTASSWKALSPALKHMRNNLEELEDLISDEALGNTSTVPILISIQSCVQALRELDKQLQFYRCSAARWQAAIAEAVADVDASLAAATTSLVSAFSPGTSTQDLSLRRDSAAPEKRSASTQILTCSDILPAPNTNAGISPPPSHCGIASEASYQHPSMIVECYRPRLYISDEPKPRQSQNTPSSAAPIREPLQNEVNVQPTDRRIEPQAASHAVAIQDGEAAEEREETIGHQHDELLKKPIMEQISIAAESEIRDAVSIPLPPSPVQDSFTAAFDILQQGDAAVLQESHKLLLYRSSDGTLQKPMLLDWRTPFAEVDPLSIDFESATSVLLGTPQQSIAITSTSPVIESDQIGIVRSDSAITHHASAHATPSAANHLNKTLGSSDLHCGQERSVSRRNSANNTIATVDGPRESPRPQSTSSDGHDSRAVNTESSTAEEIYEHFVDCVPGAPLSQMGCRESDPFAGHPSASIPIAVGLTPTIPLYGQSTASETVEAFAVSVASRSTAAATSKSNGASTETLPNNREELNKHSLSAPTSRYASVSQDEKFEQDATQSTRVDSKIDLHFSAPTSPDTPMEEKSAPETVPQSFLIESGTWVPTHSDPVSPIRPAGLDETRRASDTTLKIQEKTWPHTRSSSEPPPPAEAVNVLSALQEVLSPPQVPPKGRYHIVNPSPRSRRNSLHVEAPDLPSRSISPVSSRNSGEIPVILVQESSESSAACIATIPDTGLVRSSERSADDDITPASQRYYRQDLANVDASQSIPLQQTPGVITDCRGGRDSYDASGSPIATRINSVCQSWHRQEWTRAEAYLLGVLEARIEANDIPMIRRIRHLLGVSASFQGQWQRAVSYFISALNAPLREAAQLDEGDCAALIWLADCYVLSNRRLEAFVANSLAVQGLTAHKQQEGLLRILYAEQKAMLSGGSSAQLELKWNQLTQEQIAQMKDTIVNYDLVSPNLIEIGFNQPSPSPMAMPKPSSNMPRNRATMLCELDNYDSPLADYMEFRVTADSFKSDARWPIPYDPFFAMEQASKGRLCDRPNDLLAAVQATPQLKIPKNGPLGSARFECFTCGDLEWLIMSVRDCLDFLEMKWDEVANPQGVWFTVRFAMKHRNILTANYFAISLFKQSMRQGYGVEVCVDGVRSARVMHDSPDYPMGVHFQCEKRLKKLFKDYLTRAHRLWVKNGKPASSLSANEVACGDLAKEADSFIVKGLPLPPKTGVTLYV